MGSFFFQEIHFPGLPLVFLCGILKLVFSLCLEDFALPGGVAFVFSIVRTPWKKFCFMTFLTMFVPFFELGALFLTLGVAVLI